MMVCIRLFVASLFLISVNGCPLGCKCSKEKKLATCNGIELDNVPKNLPLFIKDFSLKNNSIRSIGAGSFPRRLNLTKLDLGYNRITYMDKDALSAAKSNTPSGMQWLSLKHNRLVTIPTDVLSQLHILKELFLSENSLKVIKSFAFAKLVELENLDLSYNEIERIANDAFMDLNKVKRLDLSSNKLTLLSPSALFHLTDLTKLDLSHNMLTKIHPESLTHFPHLQELYFAANKIETLEEETFSFISSSIRLLDLTSNEIASLKSSIFKGLNRLVVLKLSRNLLSNINGDNGRHQLFGDLKTLHVLRLDSNRIRELPVSAAAWNGLSDLTELYLSGNLISEIPVMEESALVPRVTYLDLRGNLLSALNSTAFKAFPLLERVDLADNRISDAAPDAFRVNRRLCSIRLERNKLTTPFITWLLRPKLRRGISKRMNVAHLAENPWNCDCHTLAFASAVLKSKKSNLQENNVYVDTDIMTCSEPANFKGYNLTHFAQTTKLDCDVEITWHLHHVVSNWLTPIAIVFLLSFLLILLARLYVSQPKIGLCFAFTRRFLKPASKRL